MAVCDVGMMSRRFLVTAYLVLRRFFVMAGRMFMVAPPLFRGVLRFVYS
jgi:hypothetical protein